MQHRSQDASLYSAIKLGQNWKLLAGLGLAKEMGREVQVITHVLRYGFTLIEIDFWNQEKETLGRNEKIDFV